MCFNFFFLNAFVCFSCVKFLLIYLPCDALRFGCFHFKNTAEEFSNIASIPNGASLGAESIKKEDDKCLFNKKLY